MGKHHACVWVNSSSTNLLFDCGEGTAKQLLRNKLDNNLIDSIIISHFHPDHVSGIFMVLQMFYLQKRKKTLNLYLPEKINEFKSVLDMFYTFTPRFSFKINFKLTKNVNADHKQIQPIPSDHMRSYAGFVNKHSLTNELLSYSFLISDAGKRILYTSDFLDIKIYNKYLNELDIIIIDALHTKASDIIRFANITNARIILNHGLSEELKNNLKTSIKKIEIADEKLEISL